MFAHELKNVRRETFNPRLNREKTAFTHLSQLCARKTWAYLVMNLYVGVGVSEPAEKGVDIFRSDDVVYGIEIQNTVTAGQSVQLPDYIFNSFRSEFHAGAIETTERAVIFHSPPAAARGFDR